MTTSSTRSRWRSTRATTTRLTTIGATLACGFSRNFCPSDPSGPESGCLRCVQSPKAATPRVLHRAERARRRGGFRHHPGRHARREGRRPRPGGDRPARADHSTALAGAARVRLPASTQRLEVQTPEGESLAGVTIPSEGVTAEGAPTLLGFEGNAWNAEATALSDRGAIVETEEGSDR
jgi:hypothetical protein